MKGIKCWLMRCTPYSNGKSRDQILFDEQMVQYALDCEVAIGACEGLFITNDGLRTMLRDAFGSGRAFAGNAPLYLDFETWNLARGYLSIGENDESSLPTALDQMKINQEKLIENKIRRYLSGKGMRIFKDDVSVNDAIRYLRSFLAFMGD